MKNKFSIYFELSENEFIWDTVKANSLEQAVSKFKGVYSLLTTVPDEKLKKFVYKNLNSNSKIGLEEYLQWQKTQNPK